MLIETDSMPTPRIRVGLLLDGTTAPAWAKRALELLLAGGDTELCLAVFAACPPSPEHVDLPRRLLDRYYQTVIERGGYDQDPNRPTQVGDLLHDIPSIHAKGSPSDAFASVTADQLSPHPVDVFVNLCGHDAQAPFAWAAPNGVWSLRFSDTLTHRGGPPGFWESMASWRESGSSLVAYVGRGDAPEWTLCRGYSAPNWMSVRGNQSNYYWKTAGFVARKIRELRTVGSAALLDRARQHNASPVFHANSRLAFPKPARYAALLARKTLQKLQLIQRNRTTFDQWMLLFKMQRGFAPDIGSYQRITPPPDRFWADPHVIRRGDDYYIFIEELLYSRNLGHLSVIKMNAAGEYSKPLTIIERPYHLSYPFIFEFENTLYMIPESAQNSTVELYRCTEFPGKWEFVKNLMEGVKAYDSTLIFKDGKWWLFASMSEFPGTPSSDELFLFWADNPLSQSWTPHPLNPIISDCKQARPAGRIFERDGQLYRPSQNCSIKYGYGFNIARIDTLTDADYSETVISRVEPNWAPDLVSTHTYATAGDLHVIDAELRRKRR